MVTSHRRHPLAGAFLVVLVAGFACAPSPGPGGARPDYAGAAGQPNAPKVLVWGGLREPGSFQAVIGLGPSGSPAGELKPIVHNYLAVENDRFEFVPQVAGERPSVERGTWRLNPDGSMDTTWRLRPNVKWHDGKPFTSADLTFTFAVSVDPDLPKSQFGGLRLMESGSAPDPHTFVIHWSATYPKADREVMLAPMPAHLLEERYRSERAEFMNDPYFTSDFVGLGAYRLVRWEPGSHIEFTRFDEYYLGRPPLDGVVLRFIGDPATMLSNILAGGVDIASPALTASLDAVLEVRDRWAGTKNYVRLDPSDGMRWLQIQFRPQLARPVGGLTNPTVRQALYQAIDRPGLAEIMTRGAAPIADSYVPPKEPMRPLVESAIPQYALDPAAVAQRFAQAGWTRAADGNLTSQATGERFEIDVWGRPGSASEQELSVIADNWKNGGALPRVYMIPTARVTDREMQATYPGVLLHNPPWEGIFESRLHTRDIANEANRWSGRNATGYSNPRVDPLVDGLLVTVDARQRIELHRELVHEVMTDVALMPLYWIVRPVLVLGSVRGTVSAFATGWNLFGWDKES